MNIRNTRIAAIFIIIASLGIGYFVYHSEQVKTGPWSFPFKLGLDLNGGTHLTYKADVSKVAPSDVAASMDSLRQVIERRINLFGVSEPVVQVEQSTIFSSAGEHKLVVELPGVTDISTAIALIGQTPLLEFKLQKTASSTQTLNTSASSTDFVDTGLTGRYLKAATLEFDQTTAQPTVSLAFNDEGTKLFADITRSNVGRVVGIFLDGTPISLPVVRSEIANGKAVISGGFTPTEARQLVQDLNYGALPVPIELIGTQTIGASLGQNALNASVHAGLLSLLLISLFLLVWYRLPGLFASLSLVVYTLIMLALFKLIPVTLTAAGLAGFILSMGMAVDANILIFERMKDELSRGRNLRDAIREGFARAWLSIRDGNLSTIISAVVLFWLSNTALVKGFALVLGLGVIVSMITAISLTRTFLLAVSSATAGKVATFLYVSGFTKRSHHTEKGMNHVNHK